MKPMPAPEPPIRTLSDLRQLLEAAVQLELATIPPYLCALYSIHPGTNTEAALVLRSVVVEEMLHMVLASNVLNAVGGTPRFASEDGAPRYPAYLPDGERRFEVHLDRFSPGAIDTFLKIEEPSLPHTPPVAAALLKAAAPRQPAPLKLLRWNYETVGGFYAAIVRGLEYLAGEMGEPALFSGDPARQVTPEYYYAGGGSPVVVRDLATARAALEEIMEQGEGEIHSVFDGDGDLGHFFRFMEIRHDRRYAPGALRTVQPAALRKARGGSPLWPLPDGAPLGVEWDAVYPMVRDPRGGDYPEGSAVRAASDAFNALWSRLLLGLERGLSGEPPMLLDAVGTMFELKYAALELVRTPLPGHPGAHAGPTFEFVPVDDGVDGAPVSVAGAAAAHG
jgi:hypothetical protein